MAAKALNDILDMLKNTRLQLSDRLGAYRADTTLDARHHYLVDYMEETEKANYQALERLEKRAAHPESNWIRYYPKDHESKIKSILEYEDNWHVLKKLVESTIAIKKELLQILDICARNQNVDRIQDYFFKLSETELTQLHNLSRRLVEKDQGY